LSYTHGEGDPGRSVARPVGTFPQYPLKKSPTSATASTILIPSRPSGQGTERTGSTWSRAPLPAATIMSIPVCIFGGTTRRPRQTDGGEVRTPSVPSRS
jgi:hypothetical protein